MSETAYNHDGVLTDDERSVQAHKCVNNLKPHLQDMSYNERTFVESMRDSLFGSAPTMRQLNWLKDMCEKYDR